MNLNNETLAELEKDYLLESLGPFSREWLETIEKIIQKKRKTNFILNKNGPVAAILAVGQLNLLSPKLRATQDLKKIAPKLSPAEITQKLDELRRYAYLLKSLLDEVHKYDPFIMAHFLFIVHSNKQFGKEGDIEGRLREIKTFRVNLGKFIEEINMFIKWVKPKSNPLGYVSNRQTDALKILESIYIRLHGKMPKQSRGAKFPTSFQIFCEAFYKEIDVEFSLTAFRKHIQRKCK